MLNGIISKDIINNLVVSLFQQITTFIYVDNKKNEVDELVENVVILYKKDICHEFQSEVVNGETISVIIDRLAHSKSKNFSSLSNKSIFKFIDLVEM
jgi:ABC-type antimicrobial peptide transport system ATPase subunit